MASQTFEEKQRMTKTWGLMLIILLFILFGFLLAWQLMLPPDGREGNTPLIIVYFCVTLILGALLWLFIKSTLSTHISREGISLNYPPFFSKKQFGWAEIENAYTRTYKPMKEFGGWGLRNSKNGKAYNVSGNFGLQLEFKDGKKLLIGSQKNEELEAYIQFLRNEGIIS